MEENYTSKSANQDEMFKPVGQQKPNYIKVIGVGGGGGNAVNHMMEEGIQGVDFILCNTDHQALMKSSVKTTVHLGHRELGAGNDPNIGREAAEASKEEIDALFDDDTKMLFVTAGMGGGTGTGAAPVIAKIAKEKGILTVGIVTLPFECEGRRRKQQAQAGIEELKKHVDTLIAISSDKIRREHGDMKLTEAFKKADDVLTTAAKGIAEIITVPGYVNVDFEDVKTVMKDSGKAIMGSGKASGEGRADKAIKAAIDSPLLNDSNIEGAKNILLYITSGTDEVTLDEVVNITEYVQDVCGNNSDVIWGNGTDESLGDALGVTLIATGFNHELKDNKGTEKSNTNRTEQIQKKRYDINGNLISDNPVVPQQKEVESVKKVFPEIPITPVPTPQDPVPQPEPEAKPEEKVIKHSLFSIEEEGNEPIEMDTPVVQPEPTPIPDPQPVVVHFEEEKPNVKVFDNPFQSGGEDDGFEITSRIMTQEERRAKAEAQEVALLEAKKAKEINPMEELKKQRLRALSMNFRTARGLEELENQPAYLRRNVEISQSDIDDDMSHYSTSRNGISGENPFLHDNVD